ncbi:MAG: fasciclin domain-containing protein [Bacteroidia bacterium]|nr:fasciclin domain-containing protein [Bacteroidia bacterium]
MRNKTKTSILLSFALLCAFALHSCKGDDTGGGNQPTQSISEYLTTQGGYDDFLSALDKAGLSSKISGTGAYTLLAVSDLQLANDGIDISSMSDAEAAAFASYHFIVGKRKSSDFQNGGYAPSELVAAMGSGKVSIFTEVTGSAVRFNGIAATTNFEATNGMVYVLAGTLEAPTLLEHLALNPAMKNYLSGITLEAATKTALESGSNSVFAINEDDLIKWLEDNGAIRMSDIQPSKRRTIMNNTIVLGKSLSSSAVTGVIQTEGEDITATTNGGEIVLNASVGGGIKVIKKDINATNGVIHLIDGVIE